MRVSGVAALCLCSLFMMLQPGEGIPGATDLILTAVGVLTGYISSMLYELQAKRATEYVKVKVWMYNTDDPKMNGCGFHATVNGYAGKTSAGSFPKAYFGTCQIYKMPITNPSAFYETELHLGNEFAKQFELRSEGWADTYIKLMCVGFNEKTIHGGPRVFCINGDLLRGCKNFAKKYQDVNLNYNDIRMTKTVRGIHKIVLRKLDDLMDAFKKIQTNRNDKSAMSTMCNNIDLVKGDGPAHKRVCPGQLQVMLERAPMAKYGRPKFGMKYVEVNPYGCKRSQAW